MNEFPKWADFTPAFATAELTRLLGESEKGVAAVEASTAAATFESVVYALDDATRDLWQCWGRVAHMNSVVNSPEWRKVEETFQPQVVAFSLRVGQSQAIYKAMKEVAAGMAVREGANSTGKASVRARILMRSIQGAELAGVGLKGAKRKRFNALQAEIAKLSMDFSNAVIDATKAFTFKKNGKTYTIDDAHYPDTMKHCADRAVREALYRARSTRAPENTARIAELLKLRRELAKILGFKNFAELSLATKCAPSVDAVFAMVDELDKATVKIAKAEDEELARLASESSPTRPSPSAHTAPATSGLAPWDMAYYCEKLRERKYAYSEEDFKRHFEFAKTLKGLFRMVKFLFDIDVVEVKGKTKPQVWHKDVRFFAVKEKGKTVAHFYLDPYVRNGLKSGGAWMNEFVNRDDRRGKTPLAVVVLNLQEPDAKGKTYLPVREVETLFHEFGHACQQMLTRIGEEGAAGINLVEWDAVEVASQFMENWCLDDRTGIRVPAALKAKVRAAKNFRAASACRRQLSFAKTDMLIHTKTVKDANAVKNAMFDHFGMPRLGDDLFLNAFTHIFAGGYSAGYYGYKWAEVMSADCYGAFEEAGLEKDAAMKRLGKRYRETVLGLGGSISALDVFVKFRGRKPTTEAILRQQGLSGK